MDNSVDNPLKSARFRNFLWISMVGRPLQGNSEAEVCPGTANRSNFLQFSTLFSPVQFLLGSSKRHLSPASVALSFPILLKVLFVFALMDGLDSLLLEEPDYCPCGGFSACLRRLALWFFSFLLNPLS